METTTTPPTAPKMLGFCKAHGRTVLRNVRPWPGMEIEPGKLLRTGEGVCCGTTLVPLEDAA